MAQLIIRRRTVCRLITLVSGGVALSGCGSEAVPLLKAAQSVGSGDRPAADGRPAAPAAPAAPPPTASANERATEQMTATAVKVIAVIKGTGGSDAFASPFGVAVDAQAALYVGDIGGKRVAKFDRDGKLLGQWRGEGSGAFESPVDLALGPGGNLYVLDKGRGVVHVTSTDGQAVASHGSDGAGFYNPFGIGGSPDAYFVADTGSGRVVKYSGAGKKLAEMGRGGAKAELKEPSGVLAEPDGGALVLDGAIGLLLRYSGDGKMTSSTAVPVRGPARLARLPDGSLVLSDPPRGRLLRCSPDGTVLARYGEPGAEEGRFNQPTGLAVDPDGNVYVADTQNHRVVKLRLE